MGMEEILIRPVEAADLPEVKRLNDLAFGGPDEGRLVELLHARGKALISLAAVYQEKIIGHILFSPVQFRPPHPQIRAIGLAPMAVLPEYQNQGIGSQLVRQGLAACQAGDWQVVIVLGHTAFYPRFGFRPASELGLDNEYAAGEAFMALELAPHVLDDVQSTACYADEFKEIGL